MALTLGNPDTFADAARNAQADAVDALVESGNIVFRATNDSGTILAEFDLQNPAFGSASSGTITLAGTTLSDTAPAGSATAVARWQLRTSGDAAIMSGPITGSDTITSGQTVNLTAFSITWPSSSS
ncbi:MAG TPA: hypothetical protein VKZ49_04635 [Polyangiaceae bacterium]|nr:hypothetical protein [Polyangiaceae bacterium]